MNYKKILSLITVSCFLFSFVLAQSVEAFVETQRDAAGFERLLGGFVIPQTAGRITDARCFGSSRVVINIQDLHCHPEVQKNISRILSLLDEKYKLKKVYVEGASGELDTSWLGAIKDKELKKEMLETLLEQGKLTGTEHYSIVAGRPGLLAGLEDEKIYRENLLRLNRILERKDSFETLSKLLRQDLVRMEDEYFGAKNKRFEKLVRQYREEKIDASKYYTLLIKYAGKINAAKSRALNISDIDLKNYPNVTGYIDLMEKGRKLNYKSIARQLQEFVLTLKQRLPYSAYNVLLRKTDNFSKLDELYIYLSKIAREYGLDLKGNYPQLNAFFEYTDAAQKINPIDLIREEKKVVGEVRTGLSQDMAELEVSFAADFLGCFEDYLNNRLSADDYAYFKDRAGTFKRLWAKYARVDRLRGLEPDFQMLDEYYEVNLARNECFIRNMACAAGNQAPASAEAVPAKENIAAAVRSLDGAEEVVVVVTGGFHTRGLDKLIENKKISFLAITPNVTGDTKQSDMVYRELARQQARLWSASLAPMLVSMLVKLARVSGGNEADAVNARCAVLKSVLEAVASRKGGNVEKKAKELLGSMDLFSGVEMRAVEGKDERGEKTWKFVFFEPGRPQTKTLVFEVNEAGRVRVLDGALKDAAEATGTGPGKTGGMGETVHAGIDAGAEAALRTFELMNVLFTDVVAPLHAFYHVLARAGGTGGLIKEFNDLPEGQKDIDGWKFAGVRDGKLHINADLLSKLNSNLQQAEARWADMQLSAGHLSARDAESLAGILARNPWIKDFFAGTGAIAALADSLIPPAGEATELARSERPLGITSPLASRVAQGAITKNAGALIEEILFGLTPKLVSSALVGIGIIDPSAEPQLTAALIAVSSVLFGLSHQTLFYTEGSTIREGERSRWFHRLAFFPALGMIFRFAFFIPGSGAFASLAISTALHGLWNSGLFPGIRRPMGVLFDGFGKNLSGLEKMFMEKGLEKYWPAFSRIARQDRQVAHSAEKILWRLNVADSAKIWPDIMGLLEAGDRQSKVFRIMQGIDALTERENWRQALRVWPALMEIGARSAEEFYVLVQHGVPLVEHVADSAQAMNILRSMAKILAVFANDNYNYASYGLFDIQIYNAYLKNERITMVRSLLLEGKFDELRQYMRRRAITEYELLHAIALNNQKAIITQTSELTLDYHEDKGVLENMSPLADDERMPYFTYDDIADVLSRLGIAVHDDELAVSLRKAGYRAYLHDGMQLIVPVCFDSILSVYRGSKKKDDLTSCYLSHSLNTAIMYAYIIGPYLQGMAANPDPMQYAVGPSAVHEFDLGLMNMSWNYSREVDGASISFHYRHDTGLPEYGRKRTILIADGMIAGHLDLLLKWQLVERRAKQNIAIILTGLERGKIKKTELGNALALIRNNLEKLKNECGLNEAYYAAVFGHLERGLPDLGMSVRARYYEGEDNSSLVKELLAGLLAGDRIVAGRARTLRKTHYEIHHNGLSDDDVDERPVFVAHPWILQDYTLLNYLSNEAAVRAGTFDNEDVSTVVLTDGILSDTAEKAIDEKAESKEKRPRFLSIGAGAVQKISGSRVHRAYVTAIAPAWETAAFPLLGMVILPVAGVPLAAGFAYATAVFSLLHIVADIGILIVEWVHRSADPASGRTGIALKPFKDYVCEFFARLGLSVVTALPYLIPIAVAHIAIVFIPVGGPVITGLGYFAAALLTPRVIRLHAEYNTAVLDGELPSWLELLPGSVRRWLLAREVPLLIFRRPSPKGEAPVIVRDRQQATLYQDRRQDFAGVDLEHFVHAQNMLAERLLSDGQLRELRGYLGLAPANAPIDPAMADDYYQQIYEKLAEGNYTAEAVNIINDGTYEDPRLAIEILGQNPDPKAQSVYEAIANSLDALGLNIGQFGKGVKQVIDWLEPNGSDRVDVYTKKNGSSPSCLTILRDVQGQYYLQIRTISADAFAQEAAGRVLEHGTVVKVTVQNKIPLKTDSGVTSMEKLQEGLLKRFPYVTSADIYITTSKKSRTKINGFERKVTLTGERDMKGGQGRAVDVILREHAIRVIDNGGGMDPVTLSRMFVPKQGSKNPEPLRREAAERELENLKVVQDTSLPHRISFARNGEVISAVDIPGNILPDATVEGGLMVELGSLMDVPESRDTIIIPSNLKPGEISNFQFGMMCAITGVLDNPVLSNLDKVRCVNTLIIGLDGLVQGNQHYAHVVRAIRAEAQNELRETLDALRKEGYVILPHGRQFEKCAIPEGKQALFMHENLFDWKGAAGLKDIWGDDVTIIPGVTLGGEKRLPLAVVPFKPRFLDILRKFVPFVVFNEKDQPFLATQWFIALPRELGGRLAVLALRRNTGGLDQGEENEFVSLVQRVNNMTAEEVVTSYEVSKPKEHTRLAEAGSMIVLDPESGGIDAPAVHAFLKKPPVHMLQGVVPPDARMRYAVLHNGGVVEIGTGKTVEDLKFGMVVSIEPLVNDYYRVVEEDGGKTHIGIFQIRGSKAILNFGSSDADDIVVSPDKRFVYYGKERCVCDLEQEDTGHLLPETRYLDDEFSVHRHGQQNARGTRAVNVRFSRDGKYIAYALVDGNDGTQNRFCVVDLQRKKFVCLLSMNVLDYEFNSYANIVHIKTDKGMGLVDPASALIINGARMLYTDSSGGYTAVINSAGELGVYVHKTKELFRSNMFPSLRDKSFDAVFTVTPDAESGDNETDCIVQMTDRNGMVWYYSVLHELMYRHDQGDDLEKGFVEKVLKNGILFLQGGTPEDHGAAIMRSNLDPLMVKKHPEYDICIVNKDIDSLKVVDIRTFGEIPYTGKIISYWSSGERMDLIYQQPDGRLYSRTRISGRLYPPEQFVGAYDGIPARFIVRQDSGKYQLDSPLLSLIREIPVSPQYSSVIYDGKYFVFTDPANGDTAYLDPENPGTPDFVPASAVERKPSDMPDRFVVAFDREGHFGVLDTETNAVMPDFMFSQCSSLIRVNGNVFVGWSPQWHGAKAFICMPGRAPLAQPQQYELDACKEDHILLSRRIPGSYKRAHVMWDARTGSFDESPDEDIIRDLLSHGDHPRPRMKGWPARVYLSDTCCLSTREGQVFLADASGQERGIVAGLTPDFIPMDMNGEYLVLSNPKTGEVKYFDRRSRMIVSGTRPGEKPAGVQEPVQQGKAFALWNEKIIGEQGKIRQELIAKVRPVYNRFFDLVPRDLRPDVESTARMLIMELYADEEKEIRRRFQAALAGKELGLGALPFDSFAQRMDRVLALLPSYIHSAEAHLSQQDYGIRKAYHASLFQGLFALVMDPQIDISGLNEDCFEAMANQWSVETQQQFDAIPHISRLIHDLNRTSGGDIGYTAGVVRFLSRSAHNAKDRARMVAIIKQQAGKILDAKEAVRDRFLAEMYAALEDVDEENLSALARDPDEPRDIGRARPFIVFLTHDVEQVAQKRRFVPGGVDRTLPEGGIAVSQIVNLEKQRLKKQSGPDDTVMEIEYLISAIAEEVAGGRPLPHASEKLEAEIRRNAEVQRESGAYAAEIAQNSRDAGSPALEIGFYLQRNGADEEYVEEARDSGTGALKEVALLIPKSLKAGGGQQDVTGYFGTGKYTIFEGVDRVEIITKQIPGKAFMFTFTVEKNDAGKIIGIRLTGIRAVADDGVGRGVTVRRIKKAGNTIPELDQMLAQRAWKTFAGLAQDDTFSISFIGHEGKPKKLAVEHAVLSQSPFEAFRPGTKERKNYGPLRIIGTEDMPLQIVDRAGLRVCGLDAKEDFLSLVPPQLKKRIRELGINIQIPLPLIRGRNSFEHEDVFLQNIRKHIAIEFYKAIAFKTLTQAQPQFVFAGLPMDWETNDHYWDAIDSRRDAGLLDLAGKINNGHYDAIRYEDLEKIARTLADPDVHAETKDALLACLIVLLQVPVDPNQPGVRESLIGRRLAIQEKINKRRADAQRARLGRFDAGTVNISGIPNVTAKLSQATGIATAHDQMRRKHEFIIDKKDYTEKDRQLYRLARGLVTDFGIDEVVLIGDRRGPDGRVVEKLMFAGAFAGNTFYLNRSQAEKMGKSDPARGFIDEATDTILHEASHYVENLREQHSTGLGAGEIFVSDSSFTHQAVGTFADIMKYLAGISLFRHKAPDDTPANVMAVQSIAASITFGLVAAAVSAVLSRYGIGDLRTNLEMAGTFTAVLSGRAVIAGVAEWLIHGQLLRGSPGKKVAGLVHLTPRGKLGFNFKIPFSFTIPRKILALAGYPVAAAVVLSSLVHEAGHKILLDRFGAGSKLWRSEVLAYALESAAVTTVVSAWVLGGWWLPAAALFAASAVILIRQPAAKGAGSAADGRHDGIENGRYRSILQNHLAQVLDLNAVKLKIDVSADSRLLRPMAEITADSKRNELVFSVHEAFMEGLGKRSLSQQRQLLESLADYKCSEFLALNYPGSIIGKSYSGYLLSEWNSRRYLMRGERGDASDFERYVEWLKDDHAGRARGGQRLNEDERTLAACGDILASYVAAQRLSPRTASSANRRNRGRSGTFVLPQKLKKVTAIIMLASIIGGIGHIMGSDIVGRANTPPAAVVETQQSTEAVFERTDGDVSIRATAQMTEVGGRNNDVRAVRYRTLTGDEFTGYAEALQRAGLEGGIAYLSRIQKYQYTEVVSNVSRGNTADRAAYLNGFTVVGTEALNPNFKIRAELQKGHLNRDPRTPVERIVLYNDADQTRKIIYLDEGNTITANKLTGYYRGCKGQTWGDGTRTKYNFDMQIGCVATDPDIIAPGTIMFIPGYGLAIAVDDGNYVDQDRAKYGPGNYVHIDLGFSSEDGFNKGYYQNTALIKDNARVYVIGDLEAMPLRNGPRADVQWVKKIFFSYNTHSAKAAPGTRAPQSIGSIAAERTYGRDSEQYATAVKRAAFWEEPLFRGALIGVLHLAFGLNPFLLGVASMLLFSAAHVLARWSVEKDPAKGYLRSAREDLPGYFKEDFARYLAPSALFTGVYLVVMTVLSLDLLTGVAGQIPVVAHAGALAGSIIAHRQYNRVAPAAKRPRLQQAASLWQGPRDSTYERSQKEQNISRMPSREPLLGQHYNNHVDLRFGNERANLAEVMVEVLENMLNDDVLPAQVKEEIGRLPLVAVMGSLTYALQTKGGKQIPDWDAINDIDLKIYTELPLSAATRVTIMVRYFEALQAGQFNIDTPGRDSTAFLAADAPNQLNYIASWGIISPAGKNLKVHPFFNQMSSLTDWEEMFFYNFTDLYFNDRAMPRLNEILAGEGREELVQQFVKIYSSRMEQLKEDQSFDYNNGWVRPKMLKQLYQLAFMIGEQQKFEWLLQSYKDLSNVPERDLIRAPGYKDKLNDDFLKGVSMLAIDYDKLTDKMRARIDMSGGPREDGNISGIGFNSRDVVTKMHPRMLARLLREVNAVRPGITNSIDRILRFIVKRTTSISVDSVLTDTVIYRFVERIDGRALRLAADANGSGATMVLMARLSSVPAVRQGRLNTVTGADASVKVYREEIQGVEIFYVDDSAMRENALCAAIQEVVAAVQAGSVKLSSQEDETAPAVSGQPLSGMVVLNRAMFAAADGEGLLPGVAYVVDDAAATVEDDAAILSKADAVENIQAMDNAGVVKLLGAVMRKKHAEMVQRGYGVIVSAAWDQLRNGAGIAEIQRLAPGCSLRIKQLPLDIVDKKKTGEITAMLGDERRKQPLLRLFCDFKLSTWGEKDRTAMRKNILFWLNSGRFNGCEIDLSRNTGADAGAITAWVNGIADARPEALITVILPAGMNTESIIDDLVDNVSIAVEGGDPSLVRLLASSAHKICVKVADGPESGLGRIPAGLFEVSIEYLGSSLLGNSKVMVVEHLKRLASLFAETPGELFGLAWRLDARDLPGETVSADIFEMVSRSGIREHVTGDMKELDGISPHDGGLLLDDLRRKANGWPVENAAVVKLKQLLRPAAADTARTEEMNNTLAFALGLAARMLAESEQRESREHRRGFADRQDMMDFGMTLLRVRLGTPVSVQADVNGTLKDVSNLLIAGQYGSAAAMLPAVKEALMKRLKANARDVSDIKNFLLYVNVVDMLYRKTGKRFDEAGADPLLAGIAETMGKVDIAGDDILQIHYFVALSRLQDDFGIPADARVPAIERVLEKYTEKDSGNIISQLSDPSRTDDLRAFCEAYIIVYGGAMKPGREIDILRNAKAKLKARAGNATDPLALSELLRILDLLGDIKAIEFEKNGITNPLNPETVAAILKAG